MVVPRPDEMDQSKDETPPPTHRVTQVREMMGNSDANRDSDAPNRTPTPSRAELTPNSHHSRDRSLDDPPDVSPRPHRRPNRHHLDADASDEVMASTTSIPKVHRKPPQSFSDPTASPGMRLSKSRLSGTANLEKSPHRKRSKSESRRRRDRKMIAAGELEVRQANESLMRYLRQCTEINDASLSGELEIDKSYDDRKVHRKTRSQRERRGFMQSGGGIGHGATAQGGQSGSTPGSRSRMQLHSGLTNILNTLVDDIVPNSGEIYNPFTPVISPTEGVPHLSKLFVQQQVASSYREVDDGFHDADAERDDRRNSTPEHRIIHLSCSLQRSWILFSNLGHGLLGGLALAHLLLVLTTNPLDWLTEATVQNGAQLAHAYASCFYCLAVVCLVSIFDRMDFCRLHSPASDSVSFRWIIILMIYLATNILGLSTEATVEHHTDFADGNSTEWLGKMENNRVLSVWSSLSIVRSVCAIIGWMLVGLNPQSDMLFDYLIEMERHQMENN